MEIQTYRKYLEQIDTLSIKDIQDILQKMRENNVRDSQFVLKLILNYKDHHKKFNVDTDFFIESEQEIMAGLDQHRTEVANYVIHKMKKMFPQSSKVFKYAAMVMEAKEEFKEAEETLDYLIENDETNSSLRKRKVALLKAQGMIPEAIKELVEYLKKFMSDVEAWQELCDLYLQTQDYQKAVFCAEEALLHQPHHNLLHQKVADIRYTMGGVENVELAKSYYCHALKLNEHNMRALFGLILVTHYLQSVYKSNANSTKRKEAWALQKWAISKIAAKEKESTCNLRNLMMDLSID